MAPPVLTTERLAAAYGPVQVLWDIDLEVAPGAAMLLLGANGAGKSTLLATIVGLHPALRGAITLFGERVEHEPAHRRARRHLAYMSEQGIFPPLSIRENLRLGALTTDARTRSERLERVLGLFPELATRLDDPAGGLSGGQRKMVGIAKCLMSDPKLLIMDEPSAGLAPRVVNEVIDRLDALHAEGITIVLAEQNVSFLRLASDVVVLEGGHVRFRGTRETFEHDARLREAFFGLEGLQEL